MIMWFVVNASHLVRFREKYCILYNIELLIPSLNERAYNPEQGCVAISEFLLNAGLYLPIYPFLTHFEVVRISSYLIRSQCLGPVSGNLFLMEGDLFR